MGTYHEEVMSVMDGIGRFFGKVFTRRVVEGPPLDCQEIRKHPHMVVCTHRSHTDYFLAGHTLVTKGFGNLRFAAGSNLTRLPYIGARFRSFGAFPVEREIAFDRGYVKKLCSRVMEMMEKKEALILFPEGGRSYSGSTLEVKTGILGAAVLVQARRPNEDVLVLPMAVSYEYPPDVPWFGLLLRGKKMRKRTQPFWKRLLGSLFYFGADILAFVPFLLSPRIGRTYGAVYVDHDAPRAVRSLVTLVPDAPADGKDEFYLYRDATQQLAKIMRRRFMALYRILPQHLLAAVVRERNRLSDKDAEAQIPSLIDTLRTEGRNLKSIEGRPPAELVGQGTRLLLRLKAVSYNNGMLAVRKRQVIDYCAAPVLEKPDA
ncbi:MAG: 1-acyl-sn-glycerol-3-phosphate acyltransferase [Chitinispirillaceae bacterium]|nr:1-acyl-sn-glycerol-3-phosphate acyltransferase [Chitinispirillaceae bacterium]